MMECGTTCLAMIFKYYGYFNIHTLLARLGDVTTEGTSLFKLADVTQQFGFKSDAYDTNYENLRKLKMPCIVHYNGNHYVVIHKISEHFVWVADPGYGKDKFAKNDFTKKWNGIVLTLEPTEELFKSKDLGEMVAQFMEERKSLYKKFYKPVLSPLKKIVLEILLATAVLQLLGIAMPFFTKTIIDSVLSSQNHKLLTGILAGMFGVFCTQMLLMYVRNALLVQFRVHFELEFFAKFFRHFISLKQKFYDNTRREDLISRFQENLMIRNLVSAPIITSIMELMFVFLYVPVLIAINTKLGLIALFFVGVYAVSTIYFTPIMKGLAFKVNNKNMETLGDFMDNLLGIQSMKILAIEAFKFWQWKNKYKKALNVVLEAEQKSITLTTIQRGIFFFSQVIMNWVGAYMTLKNEITMGQYLSETMLFMIVLGSMNNLSSIYNTLTELWVNVSKLNDIFLEEPENHSLIELTDNVSAEKITAKNLSFRYSEKDTRYIFKDMNFEVNKGEMIGITGRNGTGKTTLVKLFINLYSSYEGEIYLGNHELKTLNPQAVRRKIFLFPQDIYIFNGTIKENILYGNLNAGMEEIISASKLAGLHDFVKGEYLGYNHKVGDMGGNLSGGQRLKIGFARLFLSNPDVIILDEASSMLDVESEKFVMDNIKSHFKGKTIIAIAHRLNTLRHADRIWVLDNGTIAEDGPHEELMKKEGIYAQFMKSYIE
jgi:ABC-type bacteriocin/lantibiotic exporter with double-glycine peptidase domain